MRTLFLLCGHELVFCVHVIAILWPQFIIIIFQPCHIWGSVVYEATVAQKINIILNELTKYPLNVFPLSMYAVSLSLKLLHILSDHTFRMNIPLASSCAQNFHLYIVLAKLIVQIPVKKHSHSPQTMNLLSFWTIYEFTYGEMNRFEYNMHNLQWVLDEPYWR